MNDCEKTEKLLKALAEKSRLQILQCIQHGVTNPGEMAKKLKRHRSTVEKHLRILREANIVEKVPSLNEVGQLSIRYRVRENSQKLVGIIQEACKSVGSA